MNPADLLGLGGIALGAGAVLLAAPGIDRLGRGGRAAVFASVLLLLALPYDGLPLAAYLRGVSGDLSVTTLVLAARSVMRRLSVPLRPCDGERLRLLGGVAALSLVFYPLSLGVGMFDPYRLGFGDPWLVAAVVVVSLWAWQARQNLTATCLALAPLAWAVGAYESTNLWDYLIDPLLAIYAVGSLLAASVKRLVSLGARPGVGTEKR